MGDTLRKGKLRGAVVLGTKEVEWGVRWKATEMSSFT